MIIAIASLGETADSEISEKAGRAPYYLIFEENELKEVVKNPFMIGGGAGFAVGKMLGDKKVDKIVAGKFGGNIINAFEERNLKYEEAKGVVKDFLNK